MRNLFNVLYDSLRNRKERREGQQFSLVPGLFSTSPSLYNNGIGTEEEGGEGGRRLEGLITSQLFLLSPY